jgi:hypothetical protein
MPKSKNVTHDILNIGTDDAETQRRIRIGDNSEFQHYCLNVGGNIESFMKTKNTFNLLDSEDTIIFKVTEATGEVTVPGNMAVTGNMTVTGTYTVNTAIEDLLIELGNGRTGDPIGDSGIILIRGDTGTNNGFIGYDESEDHFLMGAGTFTGTSTGNLNVTPGKLRIGTMEVNDSDATTGNCIISSGTDLITGTENTLVGVSCGTSLTTGKNNLILGNGAQPSADDADNEITLGNGNSLTLRCGAATIASTSDRRDKSNIINSEYGLEFLNKLRPVQFTWNKRKGSALNGKDRLGFIAQEFQGAMKNGENDVLDLVYESNPEYLEAKYSNLIPILVKSVQELSFKCDKLACENLELRKLIRKLN